MLGSEVSATAAASAGPTPAPTPQVQQAQRRVVEGVERSTLRQQSTGSALSKSGAGNADLVASARQFIKLLEATGNVQVASRLSGLKIGGVDLYA